MHSRGTPRWLGYLGRISYMVYLLHLFMPEMTWLIAVRAGLADQLSGRPLLVVIWGVATFSLAALSWRFFEQPILARRRSGVDVSLRGGRRRTLIRSD